MAVQQQQTVLEQIENLRQEAFDIEQEAREKFGEANSRWQDYQAKVNEMRGLLDQAASETLGSEPGTMTVANISSKPTPKHGSGPVPKHANANVSNGAPTPKRRPGRPSGSTKTKPTPTQRNASARQYGQEITMPEAIWDVLDRTAPQFKKFIADYPADANGLKVAEMKIIIDAEGKRKSSAENISPQIQQIVAILRDEGKLARNDEDRRYFIVNGADLYGPPLNENGTPMKEQTDGSFLKSDGTVFIDHRTGKPFKKRKKRGGE